MTAPADPGSSDGSTRTPSWVNYAGNQEVFARYVVRPTTLEELRAVLRAVQGRGGRVRPVATGLSFSDILQTEDTLLVLTELLAESEPRGLLPLEEDLWRDPLAAEPRVRVVAGARIRELNDALHRAGLAFTNLGGFDGQTLLGAISTSTHGSGSKLGPLPSAVRSLDLVSTGGTVYRIEPENGITDPDKFRRRYGAKMILVQSDTWFRACVVSLGCMGVVHSAVVAVRPAYRLVEHKRLETWSRIKPLLEKRVFDPFRHYEVYVNPYPRKDGDYTCLVNERSIAAPDAVRVPVPSSQLSQEDTLFLPSTQRGLVQLMNSDPRFIPSILEYGLEQLVTGEDGHVDDSYRIFNVGKINSAKVLSGEYFLSVDDGRYLAAFDRLFHVIADNRRRGVYQTGPLALRFVRASDAYLSMMHGRTTAAIEIPMFSRARGSLEAILSYEQTLLDLGARPHWGQIHQFTGARGWLRRAYPEADAWLGVHAQLNSKGIFDGPFSDRLGISVGKERRWNE